MITIYAKNYVYNYVYTAVIGTCFLTNFFNFYAFYQDLVNKEVFYSVDGLWKVKPKYQF